MKNLFKAIIITGLFLATTIPIYAQSVAGSSAEVRYLSLSGNATSEIKISRVKKTLREVLEKYNSPLVDEVDSFVEACQKYNLDCYLLPSIAGLESTFGRFILPSSYNPFGWGGGYVMFQNWYSAIQIVGSGLRENYINHGATSVEQIGRIYSESPTWAVRVKLFMAEFQKEEDKLPLLLNENPVQL